MDTGDSSLIKNLNRKIILEKIIEKDNVSRAQLSKITGLNKATITSQVSELLKNKIVVETKFDKSTGGRKPILLGINKNVGYSIGIELDVDCINFLVTDLKGNIINIDFVNVNTMSYQNTKKILTEKIRLLINNIPNCKYGVVGIGIGIHGIIDKNEKIVFATHSKWENVDLKKYLLKEFNIPIFIDNNTNLCTYAEKTFYVHDKNLLCLTISSGIGLGIVINNVVYKGFNGFAGEIGHMIVNPNGEKCSCGNYGCWELYASEKAFLKKLAFKKNLENCSLEDVKYWIDEKDWITLQLINDLGESLIIGINNIINIFNPETIIINSQLISMYPKIIDHIKSGLSSNMNNFKTILYSKLGKNACALGASAIVIKNFLNISNLKLIKNKD